MAPIYKPVCFVCDETVIVNNTNIWTDHKLYRANICSCREQAFHSQCFKNYCHKYKIGDNVMCLNCGTNFTQKLDYRYVPIILDNNPSMRCGAYVIILFLLLFSSLILFTLAYKNAANTSNSIAIGVFTAYIFGCLILFFLPCIKKKENITCAMITLIIFYYINPLILLINSSISYTHPGKLHPNIVGIIFIVIYGIGTLLFTLNTFFKWYNFEKFVPYLTFKQYKIKREHLIEYASPNTVHELPNVVQNNSQDVISLPNRINTPHTQAQENSIVLCATYAPYELVGITVNDGSVPNCDAII